MKMGQIGLVTLMALCAIGLLHAGSGSGTSAATAREKIDPADFTDPKANPYFPLKPGTVSILRGTEDGERLRNRTKITSSTKVIQGVTTTVVHDVLRSKGLLKEKTVDWYAADNSGTVWYFGERTAVYNKEGQVVSKEGSWRAGVDGAVAGIIMPANPGPTDAYRQEYYQGHAEDQGWIVARHRNAAVPYGKFKRIVRSYEWTRLEPHVVSLKFYGVGVGIVREADVSGGNELLELVKVKHAAP
jgi:hypothetical protein